MGTNGGQTSKPSGSYFESGVSAIPPLGLSGGNIAELRGDARRRREKARQTRRSGTTSQNPLRLPKSALISGPVVSAWRLPLAPLHILNLPLKPLVVDHQQTALHR